MGEKDGLPGERTLPAGRTAAALSEDQTTQVLRDLSRLTSAAIARFNRDLPLRVATTRLVDETDHGDRDSRERPAPMSTWSPARAEDCHRAAPAAPTGLHPRGTCPAGGLPDAGRAFPALMDYALLVALAINAASMVAAALGLVLR